MSNQIKPINKLDVHKICSGQVVLNLATAVKELIENSLDAGATSIGLKLKEFGKDTVEVTDNGAGVHPDNFEGLALKHHTSKIQNFSDLTSVETFGFRGEALSSLCALSNVTVITRHLSQECGTKLVFDHQGNLKLKVPNAMQVGTSVTLSNLFFSLPVRHKEFHRNLKKEFGKMIHVITGYCLVTTQVKISCVNQTKSTNNTLLSTHGSSTTLENISCIYGSKQANSLLSLKKIVPEDEDNNKANIFELDGYVSSCAHDSGRSSKDRQFYFINSRPCEPLKIIKVVNEVYHQYNQNKYPFVFLNITIARDEVDINVTPDKRQIFLSNENCLVSIIKASLNKLYENIPSTYKIDTQLYESISSKRPYDESSVDSNNFKQPRLNTISKSESKEIFVNHSEQIKAKFTKWKTSNNKVAATNTLDTFFKQNIESSVINNQNNNVVNYEENQLSNDPVIHNEIIETNEHTEVTTELKYGSIENDEKPITFSDNSNSNNTKIIKHSVSNSDDEDIENLNIVAKNINDEDYEIDLKGKVNKSEIEFSNFKYNKTNVVSSNTKSNISVEIDNSQTPKSRKCVVVESSINKIKQRLKDLRTRKAEAEKINKTRFYATIDPSKNQQAESELSREISKDLFSQMKIVGQFNLGFIITKLEADLFIIDQHATDEKYNFESLQKTTKIISQKLVIPQSLELTAVNEIVLMDNINIFRMNGFDFEFQHDEDPKKKIKLTTIPMSKNWKFGREDVDELLFMLQDAPNTLCRPSRVRSMFASRACRKSVMIGTVLNLNDMRKLVDHMGTIDQPWNCPHGRPTMRHLVNLSLLREKLE